MSMRVIGLFFLCLVCASACFATEMDSFVQVSCIEEAGLFRVNHFKAEHDFAESLKNDSIKDIWEKCRLLSLKHLPSQEMLIKEPNQKIWFMPCSLEGTDGYKQMFQFGLSGFVSNQDIKECKNHASFILGIDDDDRVLATGIPFDAHCQSQELIDSVLINSRTNQITFKGRYKEVESAFTLVTTRQFQLSDIQKPLAPKDVVYVLSN